MVNEKGTEYRKKEDLKRFFYPQEWNNFYQALDRGKSLYNGIGTKFYFNFLMQTGARYNELKHVELRDVDFERNVITIRHAKTRVGGVIKKKVICEQCGHKNTVSKNLKCCMSCGTRLPDIDNFIEEYKNKIQNRRRELRKIKVSDPFMNEVRHIKNKLGLHVNDTFKFPTIQYMIQLMKNILEKQGINDWQDFSVHNIRKTHENYLLATGSNPLSMRAHMGHSIDVASAHYISANIFSQEEIGMIRLILDNLSV